MTPILQLKIVQFELIFTTLGAGYPETGSKNQSAIHWDMICDMQDGGEIWVDDELLYRDGEFEIAL